MDECFTLFRVIDKDCKINIIEFCEELDLKDFCVKKYSSFTSIEIGRCSDFNIDINVMVRETLKNLMKNEELLVKLKDKYNLEYYLERVVHLYSDSEEVHPILSLDKDIIEFLYKSKTEDDLDYYVY